MKLKLITILVIVTLNAHGQQSKFDTASVLAGLNSSADKMRRSFSEGDYVTFSNYIPPELIVKAGGKDSLIALTKNTIKDMEDHGFRIMSMTVDTPKTIINNQNNLQTVMQENLAIKTKDGHMLVKAYLVAMSADMGKNWYFADTSNMTMDELKSMFPYLSAALVIPEKERPKIYRD
jgi:hypothetical protein